MPHTQGQWIVEQGVNDYDIVVVAEGRAPERLCGYIQRESDADIIAAAPVLLAALKMLHDDVADYARVNNLGGFDNHAMKAARAAIAEAEG